MAKSTIRKRRLGKLKARGDVDLNPIERSLVEQSSQGAVETELAAFEAILKGPPILNASSEPVIAMLDGASPDDARRLKKLLAGKNTAHVRPHVDQLSDDWRSGAYPYGARMLRKDYEEQKFVLQTELLKMQNWMKEARQRVVLLFEGRDAAGKGGAIKRFMEHLNPRGARVVALEKPSEVERGQWYFQRYVQHLPTAGEIVLFDRSWYNRSGVERVMGFCSEIEYDEFLRQVRNLSATSFEVAFTSSSSGSPSAVTNRGDDSRSARRTRSSNGSFRPLILPRLISGRTTPRPRSRCSFIPIPPIAPGSLLSLMTRNGPG
jgi:hypothetical protein